MAKFKAKLIKDKMGDEMYEVEFKVQMQPGDYEKLVALINTFSIFS